MSTSAARVSDVTAESVLVIISRRRLSKRSASVPAKGASSGIGANWIAVTVPSAVDEWSVRLTRTSQSWATRDIHRPVLDRSIPKKNSR